MGIENISRLSGVVEPTNHGEIFVETPLDLSPAEMIASAQRPCLVATTSHEGSLELGALLPWAIVRRRDETTSEAASRISADGVLITSRCSTLNLQADLERGAAWAAKLATRLASLLIGLHNSEDGRRNVKVSR